MWQGDPGREKMNTRTEYRKLRRKFIIDMVVLLCQMLDMKEKELESIHLSYFKKLQKTIKNRAFE